MKTYRNKKRRNTKTNKRYRKKTRETREEEKR